MSARMHMKPAARILFKQVKRSMFDFNPIVNFIVAFFLINAIYMLESYFSMFLIIFFLNKL